jgi:hypothetical protein
MYACTVSAVDAIRSPFVLHPSSCRDDRARLVTWLQRRKSLLFANCVTQRFEILRRPAKLPTVQSDLRFNALAPCPPVRAGGTVKPKITKRTPPSGGGRGERDVGLA